MANQKFQIDRQRNQDLIKHNEAERRLHELQLNEDKARDKDMLSKALNREAAIQNMEESERQERRNEVM